MAERDVANPLIIPADVKPSSEQMRVVCTMNAGACIFRGQTILLLRVAEAGVQSDPLNAEHGGAFHCSNTLWPQDLPVLKDFNGP